MPENKPDLSTVEGVKRYFSYLWTKNPSKFWSEAKRLNFRAKIANLTRSHKNLPVNHPLKNYPPGAFGVTRNEFEADRPKP